MPHYELCKCPTKFEKKIKKYSFLFERRNAKLWQFLSDTGTSNALGSGPIPPAPPQPSNKSRLVGTSFLTDPSSVVRVLGYTIDNLDGPISVQNDFIMVTYDGTVDYKISYKVTDIEGNKPQSSVLIGFYTSNPFVFNQENRLTLISGNKGPSIFCANHCNNFKGSFKCKSTTFIYTAVDADVKVFITVKTIIPKVLIVPFITPDDPFIQYLRSSTFDCCCEKCLCKNRKIAVSITTTTDFVTLIKNPTPCFEAISRFIHEYLDFRSLSITLFEPLVIDPSLYPQSYKFPNVADTTKPGVLVDVTNNSGYAAIRTNGLPNRTYLWTGFNYIGLKLQGIPVINFYKISYEVRFSVIKTNPNTPNIMFSPSIDLQGYYAFFRWKTFPRYDERGLPNGRTSDSFGPFNLNQPLVLSGVFFIDSGQTAFSLIIYNNIPPGNGYTFEFPSPDVAPAITITIESHFPFG